MNLKRRKRVRLHLLEENLPSVEGLLVGKRGREYVVALPQLIVSADAAPDVLASRLLAIPRERVAFYEVLS